MPILNDRIVDQIDELLPEYINEEGQGLKKFLSAYFDFLSKLSTLLKIIANQSSFCIKGNNLSLIQLIITPQTLYKTSHHRSEYIVNQIYEPWLYSVIPNTFC